MAEGPPSDKNFEQWREHFAAHGPGVGDAMVDAELTDPRGTTHRLAESWADSPALFLSASLTCPIARTRIPELQTQLGDDASRIQQVVLYTREAHPRVDPAPHSIGGREWLTQANIDEGILVRQPYDVQSRRDLARRFQDGWATELSVLADSMDDALYHRFGTAPCMAVLVGRDGRVVAKQGWLEPAAMAAEVRKLLGAT